MCKMTDGISDGSKSTVLISRLLLVWEVATEEFAVSQQILRQE